MTLADRLVVMNGGRVEQVGTPSEIYSRPASRFVATFVGAPAMNMLEGEVTLDGLSLLGGSRRLAVSRAGLPVGTKIAVGIRPEAVRLVAPGTHGRAQCQRRSGRGTGRGPRRLCRPRRRGVFRDDVGGGPSGARQRGRPAVFRGRSAFLLVRVGKPPRRLQGIGAGSSTLIFAAVSSSCPLGHPENSPSDRRRAAQ